MLSSPRIQSFAIDFFSSMLKVARSLPNSSFRCSTHHIIDRSMLVAPRVQLFNAQFSSDSFNFLLYSSRTQCGPSRIERQLAATSSPVFDRKEKFDALFSGNRRRHNAQYDPLTSGMQQGAMSMTPQLAEMPTPDGRCVLAHVNNHVPNARPETLPGTKRARVSVCATATGGPTRSCDGNRDGRCVDAHVNNHVPNAREETLPGTRRARVSVCATATGGPTRSCDGRTNIDRN